MQAIAYFRVSTARQGRSGLGLEAQQAAVEKYGASHELTVVGSFTEVESGRKADRPQLAAALAACHLRRASLLVAKVDRLTRSVAFLSQLLESGVEVRFCDLPNLEGPAGRFMLNQMAAVAELEAGLISVRTKAALAAAKARGVQLGGNNPQSLSDVGRRFGREAQRRKADERAKMLAPIILNLKASGACSLAELAAGLNGFGIPTATGAGCWSPSQVSRVLGRLA